MTTILAIESSCDDTSVAVVKNGSDVASNHVSSQTRTHKKYGGVVPEMASRMHTECIHHLLDHALNDAHITLNEIDAVAVTQGPGLEGALLIGQSVAKTLAHLLQKPLIPVNHLHGHIFATTLADSPPTYPFICLIVSGGHTQLVHVHSPNDIRLISQTRDDAVGEAFDKVARCLDLGYPGGPIIEKLAMNGNPHAFCFPKAMINDGLEFSFSGLKTAVKQEINRLKKESNTIPINDICASFQHTVITILCAKSQRACQEYGCQTLAVSGGVSANSALINGLHEMGETHQIAIISPPFHYCTDNAAMIGVAAQHMLNDMKKTGMLNITPRTPCQVRPQLHVNTEKTPLQ